MTKLGVHLWTTLIRVGLLCVDNSAVTRGRLWIPSASYALEGNHTQGILCWLLTYGSQMGSFGHIDVLKRRPFMRAEEDARASSGAVGLLCVELSTGFVTPHHSNDLHRTVDDLAVADCNSCTRIHTQSPCPKLLVTHRVGILCETLCSVKSADRKRSASYA